MADLVDDQDRRRLLKLLAVFGVGGAIGYRTRPESDEELLGGIATSSGGGSATTVSSATSPVQIVIGTSAAAIDDEVDETPALGLSTSGNLYSYPDDPNMADKYTLESGIQAIFAPTLADLEDAVDTYPAWGFATNDNETYVFEQ